MVPSMIALPYLRSSTQRVRIFHCLLTLPAWVHAPRTVWRTSTPEPTYDGIIWTYTKDVTRYIPLFSKPGPFLLELDNIVTHQLTGQYASA